jgi:hypothetical protein
VRRRIRWSPIKIRWGLEGNDIGVRFGPRPLSRQHFQLRERRARVAPRAIRVLVRQGQVPSWAERQRQDDLTPRKYSLGLFPAPFRGGAQLLLRLRGYSQVYWLPDIGGPSRKLVGSDDAEICARRQPLGRALSNLPQIPAPVPGASATSQPVQ